MSENPLFSLRELLATVVKFLPAFLSGLLVLVVGALVAWLAARVVVRILTWLRLHRVVERVRWARALGKGDIRHALYSLIGGLVGAFTFIIFLNRALELWELTVLSMLLERLVLLVPSLLLAGVILLVGAGAAAVASRSVRRALFAEQMPRATFAARIVRAAILVLTVAVALIQLNIAPSLVTWAFLIAFGCLALTFALAVGLGSRRAVEAMWEELLERRRHEPGEERKPEVEER
jgi:Mechanosensitive ion channel, conserved TM helix